MVSCILNELYIIFFMPVVSFYCVTPPHLEGCGAKNGFRTLIYKLQSETSTLCLFVSELYFDTHTHTHIHTHKAQRETQREE